MNTQVIGTSRHLTVNGRMAFVESYGQGRPLLCIHSAGQSGVQWRHSIAGLADLGYQVIVPDLPGHGRSELPAGGPVTDLGRYAAFCVDLLRTLSVTRPYVVGCSIGGKIALDIATRIPGELAGVVTMAADAHNTDGQSDAGLLRAMEDAVSPSRSDRTYYGTLLACGASVDAARREVIAEMHRREDPQVSTSDLIAWNRHDLRDRLTDITCPVHLLVGADDFWMNPASAEATADRITGARFTVLDGIGHYPMEEIVDFPAVLHGWLSELPTSPTPLGG